MHVTSWRDLIYPEDWDKVFGTLLQAIKHGSATYDVEFRCKHKKGFVVPCSMHNRFMFEGTSKRPLFSIAIMKFHVNNKM